ncbi:hypothetical protein KIPB_011656, partial [Kipferlia bialata]|eukprot:g11656.t1
MGSPAQGEQRRLQWNQEMNMALFGIIQERGLQQVSPAAILAQMKDRWPALTRTHVSSRLQKVRERIRKMMRLGERPLTDNDLPDTCEFMLGRKGSKSRSASAAPSLHASPLPGGAAVTRGVSKAAAKKAQRQREAQRQAVKAQAQAQAAQAAHVLSPPMPSRKSTAQVMDEASTLLNNHVLSIHPFPGHDFVDSRERQRERQDALEAGAAHVISSTTPMASMPASPVSGGVDSAFTYTSISRQRMEREREGERVRQALKEEEERNGFPMVLGGEEAPPSIAEMGGDAS